MLLKFGVVCASRWSHQLTSDPRSRDVYFFWKCLQWSCLKAVSVPTFIIGGLWGSTATSGSCCRLSAYLTNESFAGKSCVLALLLALGTWLVLSCTYIGKAFRCVGCSQGNSFHPVHAPHHCPLFTFWVCFGLHFWSDVWYNNWVLSDDRQSLAKFSVTKPIGLLLWIATALPSGLRWELSTVYAEGFESLADTTPSGYQQLFCYPDKDSELTRCIRQSAVFCLPGVFLSDIRIDTGMTCSHINARLQSLALAWTRRTCMATTSQLDAWTITTAPRYCSSGKWCNGIQYVHANCCSFAGTAGAIDGVARDGSFQGLHQPQVGYSPGQEELEKICIGFKHGTNLTSLEKVLCRYINYHAQSYRDRSPRLPLSSPCTAHRVVVANFSGCIDLNPKLWDGCLQQVRWYDGPRAIWAAQSQSETKTFFCLFGSHILPFWITMS